MSKCRNCHLYNETQFGIYCEGYLEDEECTRKLQEYIVALKASCQQVKKRLENAGFTDISKLIEAYQHVKHERFILRKQIKKSNDTILAQMKELDSRQARISEYYTECLIKDAEIERLRSDLNHISCEIDKEENQMQRGE